MPAPALSIPLLTGQPRGTYLRNCWYVAGWSDELGSDPIDRIFLEEPVALFRDEAGVAHAVGGRCPHRFAPLGQGRVIDGALACPYHGLRFDGAGACVHNPHPGGQLPATRLPVYPLVERHGLLWIWMGEAERADAALIPDFSWLVDPAWAVVRGATRAEGHYELYSDNILDLSHANFVHPALVARAFTEGERRFWQDGETVHAEYVRLNDTLSDGIGAMLGRVGQAQDFYGEVTWHAPAVLRFDYVAGPPGTPREQCTLLPSLHAFTPETPDTTHYIWATGRDFALGDAVFSQGMQAALEHAFEREDMPIIRDSHRLMRGADFWALKPLVLGGDGGGIRARRLLQRLIAREQGATLPQDTEATV
ncbi:vanillate O-demethylase monooxygenase subunit [Novosphingobium sp. GV055]|uniref:aromatic ring-hydroxylating dioxygenase subunit alpha n=1 Tax=Novosphingobium sp. GV055 TaxID=2135690 RepID=UPI000D4759E7|nr:aromatic ring-hydroxylating dioxygenase subunit alpha [Novosphingobium sp. GV055]PTR11833.1 vanillate O-demethylase monooxygenase subunit [Novosphingobium sp. GV055]PUB04873.1 vanillate O-demethylase monooxygenase subunit [Novosphingobium sp. GV061]PUB21192.1 vanillate O-demethylase monooxygenase subunit [Novosphingobium sp. GV079]PUB42918.1 vanillate O-demethylase monooxygenase subunit [Novosphingobium sp. GV027]